MKNRLLSKRTITFHAGQLGLCKYDGWAQERKRTKEKNKLCCWYRHLPPPDHVRQPVYLHIMKEWALDSWNTKHVCSDSENYSMEHHDHVMDPWTKSNILAWRIHPQIANLKCAHLLVWPCTRQTGYFQTDWKVEESMTLRASHMDKYVNVS